MEGNKKKIKQDGSPSIVRKNLAATLVGLPLLAQRLNKELTGKSGLEKSHPASFFSNAVDRCRLRGRPHPDISCKTLRTACQDIAGVRHL